MEQKGTSKISPEQTGTIRDEEGKFVPGVSGNPAGRPKGAVSIVEAIKRKLQEVPTTLDKEGNQEKRTYMEIFVEKVFEKANKDGDVSMMKDVINRIDGMPPQTIDHTTKGEKINGQTEVKGMDELIALMEQANRNDYETNASPKGDSTTEEHPPMASGE